VNVPAITEENYLARHGAPFAFGDAALHKTHTRMSHKQWDRQVKQQVRKDAGLAAKREALRAEYQAKLAAGELRHPTRRESLEKTAAGHPDNESVQAARRLLAKYYPGEYPQWPPSSN
jgi:transketolase